MILKSTFQIRRWTSVELAIFFGQKHIRVVHSDALKGFNRVVKL